MNNVPRIQQKLTEKGLDAVLIYNEQNQRYATGFPFTDGVVYISSKQAVLLTDSRYVEAAQAATKGTVEVQMFDLEHPQNQLLRNLLQEDGVTKIGAEEQTLSYAAYERLQKELGVSFTPAQSLFSVLRASKTEEEIQYMIEAQRIAEKALDVVLGLIRPGMKERDIAAELNYQMMKNGAEGISFDTIAITGKKTSMPHGVPGDETVQAGDFVTMDFGCLKYGYCSDMTRTVAVGYATEEMKEVYEIVLEAQRQGIAQARAGMTGAEIDRSARKVIEDAGYGKYFGHSFGHSLGLNIHEAPVASPSNRFPMPAGAVISAEPGIYIPGRFGVRIEDVMILRQDGSEDITKAPKQLQIL
jgi:Xaa-Pro aminopeptidase